MDMKKETQQLEKAVMKAWSKTKVVHPSYQFVADQVGCSKQTVHRIVHKYTSLKAGKHDE